MSGAVRESLKKAIETINSAKQVLSEEDQASLNAAVSKL
jgi:hypothetical protein